MSATEPSGATTKEIFTLRSLSTSSGGAGTDVEMGRGGLTSPRTSYTVYFVFDVCACASAQQLIPIRRSTEKPSVFTVFIVAEQCWSYSTVENRRYRN